MIITAGNQRRPSLEVTYHSIWEEVQVTKHQTWLGLDGFTSLKRLNITIGNFFCMRVFRSTSTSCSLEVTEKWTKLWYKEAPLSYHLLHILDTLNTPFWKSHCIECIIQVAAKVMCKLHIEKRKKCASIAFYGLFQALMELRRVLCDYTFWHNHHRQTSYSTFRREPFLLLPPRALSAGLSSSSPSDDFSSCDCAWWFSCTWLSSFNLLDFLWWWWWWWPRPTPPEYSSTYLTSFSTIRNTTIPAVTRSV